MAQPYLSHDDHLDANQAEPKPDRRAKCKGRVSWDVLRRSIPQARPFDSHSHMTMLPLADSNKPYGHKNVAWKLRIQL